MFWQSHNGSIFAAEMTTLKRADTGFIEKAMAAVADPYRMSILHEILEKGSLRCCDVVSLTGLSQPTCSHHIKLLSDSELIECRKEGRNNFITINRENFKKLGSYFEKFSSNV
jgi:ArsR family transcriptional regulator